MKQKLIKTRIGLNNPYAAAGTNDRNVKLLKMLDKEVHFSELT